MIHKPAFLSICAASVLTLAAPLAAQAQPGTFTLPAPTPTPTPAPAGPEDERGGVAIPPRAAQPTQAEPVPLPTAAPPPRVQPVPSPTPRPLRLPAPSTAPRTDTSPAPTPGANVPPPALPASDPLAFPPVAGPTGVPAPDAAPASAPEFPAPVTPASEPASLALPQWWPWAAGGLGALGLLIAGFAAWRRRTPKVLTLAPPPPGMATGLPDPASPRLDLVLEITGATRSVMMFTLQYRLSLANRTDRAVSDLGIAVQLACARRGASNAASAGAAQRLEQLDRIGPHQSRSITGEVQLPLAAITPLRQGSVPLFVPLIHITLEGDGQPALTRSYVVGTQSLSGSARLHPIQLDTPPGSIAGLRAQLVDVPAGDGPSGGPAA